MIAVTLKEGANRTWLRLSHDIVIVGSGLAGLRAEISSAAISDNLNIAVLSKDV